MRCLTNKTIPGPNGRPIVYDLYYESEAFKAPVIVFCHGYKGFKDWGAWSLFAKAFASTGYAFLKFNFSHNGGTASNPIDFPDLQAFAQNNYTKEIQDLEAVVHWLKGSLQNYSALDSGKIILMGHSRGAGIATICASENLQIYKLITLAGVSDYSSRFPAREALSAWAKSGVYHVKNGRTQQQMPHHFQFYKDFIANQDRLTISKAAKKLKIPHLIIHGGADNSVDISEAKALQVWSPYCSLCIIDNANHVFGAKHPWNQAEMPTDLQRVYTKTIDFINN